MERLREFIRRERATLIEQRDAAVATYHRASGALAALDGLEHWANGGSSMTVDQLEDAIERGKLNGGSDAHPES